MGHFKRVFFDIETSYMTGWFWRPSFKTSITYDQVIKDSAIICICYKYEGSPKIYHLKWDKGCDKEMINKFVNVINDADEVVGHNSDRFDLKWIRTRCLIHGHKSLPEFKSIDTLKISRQKFNFPSNRLDAIGKYLGFGGKKDTGGIQLWHDIIQRNSSKAMTLMVEYCKRDVELLEKVYLKLEGFAKPKTHIAVYEGGDKCDCPYCGSESTQHRRVHTNKSGNQSHEMSCNSCRKYYRITNSEMNFRTIRSQKREINRLNELNNKKKLFLE